MQSPLIVIKNSTYTRSTEISHVRVSDLRTNFSERVTLPLVYPETMSVASRVSRFLRIGAPEISIPRLTRRRAERNTDTDGSASSNLENLRTLLVRTRRTIGDTNHVSMLSDAELIEAQQGGQTPTKVPLIATN